jgi:hypothetical protein
MSQKLNTATVIGIDQEFVRGKPRITSDAGSL